MLEQCIQAADAAQLQDLLEYYDVDLTSWGQGTNKSVQDLFEEAFRKRECMLRVNKDGQLERTTVVVKMILEVSERGVLCEVEQRFPDGRVKQRSPRPPGGKVASNESCYSALVRELQEELGLEQGEYSYDQRGKFDQLESSSSYPNLPTRYEMVYFRIVCRLGAMARLCAQGDEFCHVDGEGGKTLVFRWLPRTQVDLPPGV